jgi:hypothetical protein
LRRRWLGFRKILFRPNMKGSGNVFGRGRAAGGRRWNRRTHRNLSS